MTDKLCENITNMIEGELILPEEEMDFVIKCTCCKEEHLEVTSHTDLEIARTPGKDFERKILICKKCNKKVTVNNQVQAALAHGYKRLNKPTPSEEDIDNLIWKSLRKRESYFTKDEIDLWKLDFACIQLRVNLHDWRHRKSCFKNGRTKCRYQIPSQPNNKTNVTPIFESQSKPTNSNPTKISQPPKEKITELLIDIKKRSPFILLTDSNPSIMSVMNCNNCTKYVRDQKLSMYYGAYTTKHSTDCEKALAEAMIAIEKHEIKVRKEQEKANEENQNFLRDQEMQEDTIEQEVRTPCRSSYSIGLGKLLASIRAFTNGDTIGGPLAAYALLGNDIFALSHKTAPLPLMQAIAYLEKENIYATITRFGEVKASIHDYVFRATQANKIDTINFWNFTRTQESCKLSPEKSNQDSNKEDDEPEQTTGRQIYKFSDGHLQHKTQGHRDRTNIHWAKYLAKRLPDLDDLEEDSALLPEERDQRRDQYAKGILIMFIPFREKTDLVNEGETWWNAYKRQKAILYENQDTKRTIDSVQNFYESFCRSSPETQSLDFTDANLQQIAQEENEALDTNEEELNIIDIDSSSEEEKRNQTEDITNDPFIKNLPYLRIQWIFQQEIGHLQQPLKLLYWPLNSYQRKQETYLCYRGEQVYNFQWKTAIQH